MLSIGPSFLILGLVLASVTAQDRTSQSSFSTVSEEYTDSMKTTETPFTTHVTMDVTNITGTIINTTNESSITPSSTKQKGPTPTPMHPKQTEPTTKTNDNLKDKNTTTKPNIQQADSTGISILVVIILVAFGFGIACFLARKRGRRYSVDFTSRHDDVNIPLSSLEPVDGVSQNGLQTFERAESPARIELQEPEVNPEVQEEQKAEADKSAVDPSAESAAPAPSPDSAEDKPREDHTEQSPPAPVEPSVEEKTDDEGGVSNKTSVESLRETNENNSNNADFSQMRDLKPSSVFWDIPLDCPV